MHCVAAFQGEILIHFSSLIALDFANTHILQDFFAPTTRITQQDQALWCPIGKVGLRPAPPDGSVLSIHSTIPTPMKKENSLTTNHSGQFCPGFPSSIL